MDVADFSEQYATLSDDEVLRLWAERKTLVPEATIAIESEVQRRELKKDNAARVKKRLDTLEARKTTSLADQVAEAKYNRNMRHFIGWEEPEFYSPYSLRDPRRQFAAIKHRYTVWKAFRAHTGHWPVLSIGYHFISWVVVWLVGLFGSVWLVRRNTDSTWGAWALVGYGFSAIVAQHFGAQSVRKMDWKRYGS